MSGEAYEMPDGLLTMDAADAADAWYREASALRSRVEALEGVLQKIADAPCEREQGCIAHRIARAALQPDKGERCGGRGWFPLPRQERTPTGRNSRDCPGCADCSEAP